MTQTQVVRQFGDEPDPAKRLRKAWGAAIRDQREMLGLTLEATAEKMAEIGHPVTGAAIGMWERGETSPRWHFQIAIAKVLGTTRNVLFRDEAA